VQVLNRTREAVVSSSWMQSNWKMWSKMEGTSLPNPNSGIDGVVLSDGRGLLVYNHVGKKGNQWGGRRSPLNVAVSKDGMNWDAALVLESEPGEYSYPAVIQSSDGLVHITYTWKRQRIKYVVVDPTEMKSRSMADAGWEQ